jgi:hypothetical protein
MLRPVYCGTYHSELPATPVVEAVPFGVVTVTTETMPFPWTAETADGGTVKSS